MDLIKENTREITKDNFGAEVCGGKLFVPMRLLELIGQSYFISAEELISLLIATPLAVSKCLGWTEDEVIVATEQLKAMLKGYVSDVYLHPSSIDYGPLGVPISEADITNNDPPGDDGPIN